MRDSPGASGPPAVAIAALTPPLANAASMRNPVVPSSARRSRLPEAVPPTSKKS